MLSKAEFQYETASAVSVGCRDTQEDSLAADFPVGSGLGFAVLADGMGGHAAGDVASKIVVTEVFSELMLNTGDADALESNIEEILQNAALGANDCVAQYTRERPEAHGMGATLLAPVIVGDRLYWISVGDSPLYLFRGNRLFRLNQDHSLIPHFDYLVSNGMMGVEEAATHPNRNSLTSVLIGQEIPHIDCRSVPVHLEEGDLLLVASDGLQHLEEPEIAEILRRCGDRSCMDITAALMQALNRLDDPTQDNVTICAVRIRRAAAPVLAEADDPPEEELPAADASGYSGETITVLAAKSGTQTRVLYRMSRGRSA